MKIEQNIGLGLVALAGRPILNRSFNRAQNEAEGVFVPRPSEVTFSRRQSRDVFREARNVIESTGLQINKRANDLLGPNSQLNELEALNYAIRSLRLEQQLEMEGVYYGDKAFNFVVNPMRIPKSTLDEIEETALSGYQSLCALSPQSSPTFSETQQFLATQESVPNGARVDVIIKDGRPQIIEINAQWIDAITALEGFQQVSFGRLNRPSPTQLLASVFQKGSTLAICNLVKGNASRTLGPVLELQNLAKRLIKWGINAEVLDPRIVRLDYLKMFSGYYVNGDPQMITEGNVPDWVEMIYGSASTRVFPRWTPSYDEKKTLVALSSSSSAFVPTFQFTRQKLEEMLSEFKEVVLKINGFSCNGVFLSSDENFNAIITFLDLNPDDASTAVLQPFLTSDMSDPIIGCDTSSNRLVYVENPRLKYNVWVINGKVAGILLSASKQTKKVISDKDFNCIPIPI